LNKFDSVELPACYWQMFELGHILSDLQPSCDIRNDPSPVALHSDLAGDRRRFFQLTMALVDHTQEVVLE
jgi:hypothetical protein